MSVASLETSASQEAAACVRIICRILLPSLRYELSFLRCGDAPAAQVSALRHPAAEQHFVLLRAANSICTRSASVEGLTPRRAGRSIGHALLEQRADRAGTAPGTVSTIKRSQRLQRK